MFLGCVILFFLILLQEESDSLENQLQEQRKKLQAKHSRELESARVTEQLETEKAKKAETVEAKKPMTEKEKEEFTKKISELEEKLKDSEEDVDANNDLVSQLTISHRQAIDEVEEARKTIMKSDVSWPILCTFHYYARCSLRFEHGFVTN